MVGPVMQVLLDRLSSVRFENLALERDGTETGGADRSTPRAFATLGDGSLWPPALDAAIASMPTPVMRYLGPSSLGSAEPGDNTSSISEGDEGSSVSDLNNGFALPPPAVDLDDPIFDGDGLNIFGGGSGLPAAHSGQQTDAAGRLAAADLATAHLGALLQRVPVPIGHGCPSPPETATEEWEDEPREEAQEALEAACVALRGMGLEGSQRWTAPTRCPRRRTTKPAGSLPCGAAVRVGRRRVAARPPRQVGLAARRSLAARARP
mmetsp:Transcript_66502/g.214296  ORF Transcript_66502/g.214296 Transcript_66502/m.214296 type:complete len:265 (-) Transcript_66502:29-823(-)